MLVDDAAPGDTDDSGGRWDTQTTFTGLCRPWARSFSVYDEAEESGLSFLGENDQQPAVQRLLEEGRYVITV